jgi:hypothetical protein
VVLFAVFLSLLAVAGRLVYLQVLNHERFTTLSESNRVRLQPLPPTRGFIYDRNGVLLADNLASYHLEITREQVKDLDTTLAELRQRIELTDADIERYRKLARRAPPYTGVPLRFRLTDEEIARLAIDLYRLPGVDIKADLTRRYPLGRWAFTPLAMSGGSTRTNCAARPRSVQRQHPHRQDRGGTILRRLAAWAHRLAAGRNQRRGSPATGSQPYPAGAGPAYLSEHRYALAGGGGKGAGRLQRRHRRPRPAQRRDTGAWPASRFTIPTPSSTASTSLLTVCSTPPRTGHCSIAPCAGSIRPAAPLSH